uniref:Uncharacterized protein n=1 Tax=Strongyloides stercoralis TaxID=6248 RepID=A0A0K0EMN3_STRER
MVLIILSKRKWKKLIQMKEECFFLSSDAIDEKQKNLSDILNLSNEYSSLKLTKNCFYRFKNTLQSLNKKIIPKSSNTPLRHSKVATGKTDCPTARSRLASRHSNVSSYKENDNVTSLANTISKEIVTFVDLEKYV